MNFDGKYSKTNLDSDPYQFGFLVPDFFFTMRIQNPDQN